jgi:UDP-N-acetyl-2-amino-2-deoxyglucuronate dehydrogenase
MAAEPLSAAVLGLGAQGQLLLEAARAGGRFRIRAVADPDRQRAEQAAVQYGCDAYTDCRQLIVQNHVDALLVAADIHTYGEHVKAAVRRKVNILKLAPPARSFAEALELTESAHAEMVRFAVANPLEFRSSFRTAHAWIAQGRINPIFLVIAQSCGAPIDRANWQSDPVLAGGGVLLYDGYGMIDQILRSFPVPQQVYALNSSQASDKQQRLYLTEDAGVVSLKFTEALTGSLIATRCSRINSPPDTLKICGRDGVLTVTDNRVVLTNLHDGTEETQQSDESNLDIMIRLLDCFAHDLTSREDPPQTSSIAENLRSMALLEAVYLSARTGFPEEPGRVLQQAKSFLPVGAPRA